MIHVSAFRSRCGAARTAQLAINWHQVNERSPRVELNEARRLGDGPALGHVASRGPRQAQLDGFDLHANVWVPPNDRARLEQRGRYLLRPPLAQDRVQLRADGRVLVTLKTVWRDGTSHLLFEPIEFLEKLAAIIPTTTSHYTW